MVFSIVLSCGSSWLGHSGHLQPLLEHLLYGLMVTRDWRCLRPPMHLTRRSLHQHRRQFILEITSVIIIVLLRGRSCLWSERFDDGLWLGILFVIIIVIAIKD